MIGVAKSYAGCNEVNRAKPIVAPDGHRWRGCPQVNRSFGGGEANGVAKDSGTLIDLRQPAGRPVVLELHRLLHLRRVLDPYPLRKLQRPHAGLRSATRRPGCTATSGPSTSSSRLRQSGEIDYPRVPCHGILHVAPDAERDAPVVAGCGVVPAGSVSPGRGRTRGGRRWRGWTEERLAARLRDLAFSTPERRCCRCNE